MPSVGPLRVPENLVSPEVAGAFRRVAEYFNEEVRSCIVCRFTKKGTYVCNEHQKTVDLFNSLMKDLEEST
jgi:hypothetical protein